jgi:ribosome-associated toxin RatA of RatAB toxin-antitoxin module
MRHVEIQAFIRGLDADTVFDTLSDFRHYAALVDVVRSVQVEPQSDGTAISTWEVEFRNGLLRWTERDWFRRDRMRIDFDQIEGDFDEFRGGWVLQPTPQGVHVSLVAAFDFGVPSLASIVEPVAARVLTDVTHQILAGIFEGRAEFEPSAVGAAVGSTVGNAHTAPSAPTPSSSSTPSLSPSLAPMAAAA